MAIVNPVLETIHERASVRVYDDRPVNPEVKAAILEAAYRAPTAGNMMLYSVIDVQDEAVKAQLAKSCDDQAFIGKAPWVLIFLADYQRWYDLFTEAGCQPRPLGPGDLMLACADALIAAQTAVVAAQSLGVHSCYIGDVMEQAEFHRDLLNLPPYVFPAAMLTLGYPKIGQIRRRTSRQPEAFVLHKDRYVRRPAAEYAHMIQEEMPLQEARKLYQRKIDSAFSREMSRSMQVYLKDWGVE